MLELVAFHSGSVLMAPKWSCNKVLSHCNSLFLFKKAKGLMCLNRPRALKVPIGTLLVYKAKKPFEL